MGNEASSQSRRSSSAASSRKGKRLSADDVASLFIDNVCTAVSDYASEMMNGGSDSAPSRGKSSRVKSGRGSYDESGGPVRKRSDDADDDRRRSSSGRRPRTSYDDDTASEIDESTVDTPDDTDADTMVTDCTDQTPAGMPLPAAHHNVKPLASSFAKKCYFTKAGIGKNTQHYEGLALNGSVVLMLASAMKLKGCPTICDEDLRRVEKTYPNQFSRLPDELMLSSGWRRISKYCHFSNKPIPDGVPFFHSKEKLHANGGYYFLRASAIGMVRPIDVEPLTRDHLVVLETDYPTQCDAAPPQLIQNPNLWTLVQKFCFFSGGPINAEEDVYYEADFEEKTIYMLAFLSPALTPEELYLLDDNKVTDTHNPIRMSVDAVRDVESVYDLTERDFEDLKLYHLGPCRALPPHLLQPAAWRKVLPEHFCHVRERALERARDFEERYGKIQYAPLAPGAQADMLQPETVGGSSNFVSLGEHPNSNIYGNPDLVPQDGNAAGNNVHQAFTPQHPPQVHFYVPTQQHYMPNDGVAYHPHSYLQYGSNDIAGVPDDHMNGAQSVPTVADVVPRPHDECEGMDFHGEEELERERSTKVSVVSFGGDVDVEAGTHAKSIPLIPKDDDAPGDRVDEGDTEEEPVSHEPLDKTVDVHDPEEAGAAVPTPPSPPAPAFTPREEAQNFNELYKNSEEDSFSAAKNEDYQYGCVSSEDHDDMQSYEEGPGMIKSNINSLLHSSEPWGNSVQRTSRATDIDGLRTVDSGISSRNSLVPIVDEEEGPHDEASMYRERGVRSRSISSVRRNVYGHDDEARVSRERMQNDENDESRIHVQPSVGNSRIRKDRTMFEDEYSVGRRKAAPSMHVRKSSDGFTDSNDDDHTVGSVRSSGVRSAHILFRQRQLQDQTLAKRQQLHEQKQHPEVTLPQEASSRVSSSMTSETFVVQVTSTKSNVLSSCENQSNFEVASVSPTPAVSADDKNSRRALILKMAKARMQKNKPVSENYVVRGQPTSEKIVHDVNFNFDLD